MDNYYDKQLQIKLTKKQCEMLGVLVDILGENRSKIVRRLLISEGKRAAAYLEGDELDLWVALLNQIEMEEELHEFTVGEAISRGRQKAYKEKTGKDMSVIDDRELDTLAGKQRMWQRNHRKKVKLEKLKKLADKWDFEIISNA